MGLVNVPSKNSLDFKKENKNGNQRKNLSTSLERTWLALERWQGLCRRWLLPQRTDGSGSRPDEGGLRNHLRQPQRQHAPTGCEFRGRRFLRRGRGQASGLYVIPRQPGWAQRSKTHRGWRRVGPGSI